MLEPMRQDVTRRHEAPLIPTSPDVLEMLQQHGRFQEVQPALIRKPVQTSPELSNLMTLVERDLARHEVARPSRRQSAASLLEMGASPAPEPCVEPSEWYQAQLAVAPGEQPTVAQLSMAQAMASRRPCQMQQPPAQVSSAASGNGKVALPQISKSKDPMAEEPLDEEGKKSSPFMIVLTFGEKVSVVLGAVLWSVIVLIALLTGFACRAFLHVYMASQKMKMVETGDGDLHEVWVLQHPGAALLHANSMG